MARFARVIDSRTIVVERIDAAEVVHLTNVNVPAEDEQAARCLHPGDAGRHVRLTSRTATSNRSPDALLFINANWPSAPTARPPQDARPRRNQSRPRAPAKRATPVREPMQVPKPHRVRRKL